MKNHRANIGFRAFLVLAALFSLRAPAYAEYITGSGCSVSNVGYLSDLASEYERQTGVKVLVRGGGTVVGIEDVRNGKVDFAASCRRKKPEDPKDLNFVQVAWDALSFITHKSNPVGDITLDEARQIYEGRITNWNYFKGGSDAHIKVFISRPKKGLSGVESSVRDMVMKGADFPKELNAVTLASTGIVEQMVEQTTGSFATTGFSSARKRDVKMLKVGGVYPDKKSISTDRYPLRRPLFIILPKNPKPETKKFLDFVLGRKGQQYIGSLGVVSLLDVK